MQAAPSYTHIIRIMNMVRAEADIAEIDEQLKVDPVIAYRLMTHVNSVGVGFPREINSFKQAVTLLGYHGLYRWLAVLLVTASPQEGKSVVTRTAIIRGRFLELLGMAHSAHGQNTDDLFVVGIFSLLDAIFGEPMEKLVGELSIGYAMREALLTRDGPYGLFLLLVEAVEIGDDSQVEGFQTILDIPSDLISDIFAQATDWADRMLGA